MLTSVAGIAMPHALSHLTATVQGLATIKTFGCEQRFVETFEGRIDRYHNFSTSLYASASLSEP